MDCMAHMAQVADKFYDLSIVDPPYGIGEHGKGMSRHKGGQVFTSFEAKNWDFERPSADYWKELFRVSKNQIIWGANYFASYLPSSMGWVYWDKMMGGDFSDGELAFTSFNRALKSFTHSVDKNRATNAKSAQKWKRIHPCQKPVALYKWLLTNYAKDGDVIFDSHLGSQSLRIAAYDLGFDFYGTELDADYFSAGNERFERHIKQASLFEPQIVAAPQTSLFETC